MDAWTVTFSPDSKFVASGSHSGKINLYSVESGKQELTLDTRGRFTLSIAYVRINKLVLHVCHHLFRKIYYLLFKCSESKWKIYC